MHHRAPFFSLFLLCAINASENCQWRFLQVHDTLDMFLAGTIVGESFHSVEYHEKERTIIDFTTTRINADVSGTAENRMEVDETRTFNDQGGIISASQRLMGSSGTNAWKLEKTSEGWMLHSVIGGQKTKNPVPSVPDNLLSDCRMRRDIQSGSMRIGQTWRDTILEMMSGKPVVATTVCTSVDTVRRQWAFEITDDLSGRTEKCVLDKDGKTMERSIEGIYTAQRRKQRRIADAAAPASPASAPRPGDNSITELFAIDVEGACPKDKSVAVVLVDSSLSLDSSVQFLYNKQGNVWFLRELPKKCLQGVKAASDTTLSQWLLPGPAIQSSHPKITGLARKLRGKKIDPCAIVTEFNHYVFSHLQKRNAAVFSNALETLNAGYGDCGEHAALLTALLRAAGVPARVALGLLYVESRKQYLYHAQVMAYTGEWIFADPTWDAFPASGRFVPLIIDDTGTNAMLLSRLINRIRIEYVKGEGRK
jgi:hypothetical protein